MSPNSDGKRWKSKVSFFPIKGNRGVLAKIEPNDYDDPDKKALDEWRKNLENFSKRPTAPSHKSRKIEDMYRKRRSSIINKINTLIIIGLAVFFSLLSYLLVQIE